MMRAIFSAVLFVALAVAFTASPAQTTPPQDPDVARLSAQLERLSADPVLGQYAFGQRTLARNAIADLENAGRSRHDHARFMAEQRVALAEASAKADADRAKLGQLQRKHDLIMLQASQADAAAARAELARQRLQYEAAVQQTQMLQAQGAQATEQAQQAQAEAEQARKLAAAQSRAATLARKQAKLAEAATKALQESSAAAAAQQDNDLSLTSLSFQSDSGDLTAAGKGRVTDFAHAHSNQRIVIEPRAPGSARVLAGRRAVAVEAALQAAGASKVSIKPVAETSNGTEIEIRAER